MLKKLVKYGNSNALVLDKALLELLNISEGSVVKIKTDGVSLIITPQSQEATENISSTIVPHETMLKVIHENMISNAANPENMKRYIEESQKLRNQYLKNHENSGAYLNNMNALVAKYLNDENCEYGQAFNKEKFDQMSKAFKEFFAQKENAKISEEVGALQTNPDFINEMVILSEKYEYGVNSEDYLKEYFKLVYKYIPEYEEYQKAIAKVGESCK